MVLTVQKLRHLYAGKIVLDLPQWQVARGTRHLILGRSGSGKTTLLHALAGILRPSEGTISVNGTALESLGEAALDRFRGANLGIVLQRLHLIRALNVRENLRLAQRLANVTQDDARIAAVLTSLELADKLQARPHQLSHGQAQRVAIARAVLNRPSIILADEPTSNLDDENCEEAIKLLMQQAQANGAALIVATHDARLRKHFSEQLVLEQRR